MNTSTSVYLITGFLGSGKTTLLNRIINRFPKDKKLTLLVNEFGDVGVDGTLVEGEDVDMMEISKGSIFCVCVKTDFIKGLYELNVTIQPDVLLIESTGVANPSDLKKDLALPIFNDRFKFREQFCVVDAAHFLDAYGAYASIEKQIASSSVFIINKTDVADPQKIEETKTIIREFHPDPSFFETTYSNIPLDTFFDLVSVEPVAPGKASSGNDGFTAMSEADLDQFVEALLDSPDLELTPPDLLVSATYQWDGDDLAQIRRMAESLPKQLLRAKGFVVEQDEIHLFSYVMGDWTLSPVDKSIHQVKHKNTIVFIGPPDAVNEIGPATTGGSWRSIGMYQPYSP
ncbi:MAG: GTP-binding protein [Desulfobacteraceae bacterium]|nr:GTP-binding protein [Desulfobacteraceae bacterium]